MFKGKVLLFSLLLIFATSAFAGDVDDCKSQVGTSCPDSTMRISCCPQGDFGFFSTACLDDTEDGYVWVLALDSDSLGIADIPTTDYWINACVDTLELCLCASPIVADSMTNSEGRTTISGRLAVGGCVDLGGVYIAIQGKQVLEEPGCVDPICLDIQIISPDLNRDCKVDLADLTFFGLSYNLDEGEDPPGNKKYDTCCDYNHDDKCNLSDLVFFGEHKEHECF
jgi:hypothetical protein